MNKIVITETKDQKIANSILLNPKVYRAILGQDNIKEFILDSNKLYYLIQKDNSSVGLAEIKDFTKIVCELHITLLPEVWGKTSREIVIELLKHIKDQTVYKR